MGAKAHERVLVRVTFQIEFIAVVLIGDAAVVDGIQRMGRDGQDLRLAQVACQVEDVLAQPLDFAVLGLVDVQSQHMDLAAAVWKVGGDLFADEDIAQMGDLEGALDAVMIGNRDMAHAPALGDLIELQRFGEAFGAADLFQDPLAGPLGVLGMDMDIDTHAFFSLGYHLHWAENRTATIRRVLAQQ